MALIDDTKLDSVRKMIDLSLTAQALPDAVMNLDDFKGEAIRLVQRQSSNDDAHTQRAARAYLATLIIPSIVRLVKESNAGYSYELEKTDWTARIAQLEEIAARAIADSENASPSAVGIAYADSSKMTNFTVAESRLPEDSWF